AADGAADAAALQEHHVLVDDLLDEEVIDADLAELVDQHRRIGQVRLPEQTLQERRLAGPEKSAEQVRRDRGGPNVGHRRPTPLKTEGRTEPDSLGSWRTGSEPPRPSW